MTRCLLSHVACRLSCFLLWSLFLAVLVSRPGWADEPDRTASPEIDVDSVVSLLELLIDADAEAAGNCLAVLTEKVRANELDDKTLVQLRRRLEPTLQPILDGGSERTLYGDAALLAAYWKQPQAVSAVRELLVDEARPIEQRMRALDALIAIDDTATLTRAGELLRVEGTNAAELQTAVLAALGRSTDPQVATLVLEAFDRLDEQLRPKAIELLTQRADWSKPLLTAIAADRIPADSLNANQVARLQMSRDDSLKRMVANVWGTVRQERNPQREQVIAEMQALLGRTPGDAIHGQLVFDKVCGQCHRIHGRGTDVGPDITSNGRNSYEQLLSNVFDPSLVIGASYQARVVVTDGGRVLTGLLVEDSDSRIVLKMQGGKQEVIPRNEIDEISTSQLSMMPEGLENQLSPSELADLFAFLTLDLPPSDPQARPIPGTPDLPRVTP